MNTLDNPLLAEFLAVLYEALMDEATTDGVLHSIPKVGPGSPMPHWTVERLMREHPGPNVSDLGDWHCQLHGTRNQWWMEIVDERMPAQDKPYRVSLYENALYLNYLAAETLRQGRVTSEEISYSVSSILTDLDEKIFGQSEALEAYENGATAANHPWIVMTHIG